MDVQGAYDQWAIQYDINANKTRDLEARAIRELLKDVKFSHCLEIGCGTGKNTVWLSEYTEQHTAVDISSGMLSVARAKIKQPNVNFIQADITGNWWFVEGAYDLVTFSLVLEHIHDLTPVFMKASQVMREGGTLYIGELHPFKQYTGTKARFETGEGTQVVTCFNHHVSDFIQAGHSAGLKVVDLREYFDEEQDAELPRILSILFRK